MGMLDIRVDGRRKIELIGDFPFVRRGEGINSGRTENRG
jgi:hypothetical protein